MFRTHGRPDLLREDEAIDELGVRVRRVRRVALRIVVAASLVSSGFVAFLAWTIASPDASVQINAKGVGALCAAALFGVLFGGHRVASAFTLRWAEGAARRLAAEKRCDVEPLVEAARLFAGGGASHASDEPPSEPPRPARRRR